MRGTLWMHMRNQSLGVDKRDSIGYNDAMRNESKQNLKWAGKILLGIVLSISVISVLFPPATSGNTPTLMETCKSILKEVNIQQIKMDMQQFQQSIKDRGVHGAYDEWRASLIAMNSKNPSWGAELLICITPEKLGDKK